MQLNEFIEQYEALKNTAIKMIIDKDYVPYAIKVGDCRRIIDCTTYTNTEPKMFCMNSPSRYMLLRLQLVIRYTSLEFDQSGEGMVKAYDDLDRVGALDSIIAAIPEREVETYNRILDMMLSDFQMNERSLVGYLDTKLASLSIMGDEIAKLMDTVSV